jgi:hypothetical protein
MYDEISTQALQKELASRKRARHDAALKEAKESIKDVASIAPAVAAEGFGFIGSLGKALTKLGRDFRHG